MRLLATGVRWLYGLQSLSCLLLAWAGFRGAERQHLVPYGGALIPVLVGIAIALYLILAGLLPAIALWRARNGGGRALGIAAAVLNLPLFPVGTMAGIAGLLYFRKRRDPLRTTHRPVEGDGTSRISQAVWFLAQYLWVFAAYEPLRTVMVSRGLVWAPWNWQSLLIGGVAMYAATFIHESGHYVAGRMAGFRLLGFRICALDWRWSAGKWKFRIAWTGLIGGGLTAMAPASVERLRERAVRLTAGGPIASLLCGVAAFGALLAVAGPSCPPLAGRFLVLLAVIATGDGLLNLYPAAGGVGYSDGARLWQLARRGPWSEYLCANYYMMSSAAGPLRPRDWPTDLVVSAAEFGRSLPSGIGAAALAYTHFEDLGDAQRAGEYLALAESRVDRGGKAERDFAMERAYFDARFLADPAAGLRWMASARDEPTADSWRTRAAVYAAAGQFSAAHEALECGLGLVASLPDAGIYAMVRRQYEDLREAIESSSCTAAD